MQFILKCFRFYLFSPVSWCHLPYQFIGIGMPFLHLKHWLIILNVCIIYYPSWDTLNICQEQLNWNYITSNLDCKKITFLNFILPMGDILWLCLSHKKFHIIFIYKILYFLFLLTSLFIQQTKCGYAMYHK